jgi:hypothetical protein
MSPLMLTILVCFPLAVLTALFNNAFAFDRHGALAYLCLPVPGHQVFLAKNVVFGVITAVLTLVGAVPIAIALGSRVLPVVLPFFVLFWYLLFGFLAFGNLISLLFPKAIDPQSVLGWINPVASLPLTVVTGAVLLGLPSIVFFGGSEVDFAVFLSVGLLLTITAWVGSLFGAAAMLRRRGCLMEQQR